MRKKIAPVLLFLIVWSFSCKKKEDTTPAPTEDPTPVAPVSVIPDCESLPPEPKPFGWTDSTLDASRNFLAFNYNPLDPNEFVYVLDGDIGGYSPIYFMNVVSGQKKQLGNAGPFLPNISKTGWLTYSSIDNNVYKIKCNGDSVSQLSLNNISLNPHWDYRGRDILFFQEATQNISSQIVKLSASGEVVLQLFQADVPQFATFNKSDQILYCQISGTLATLVHRNLVTSEERVLLSGPYTPKTGKIHFNHLCLDLEDENFYWANDLGIFRANLASVKVDTLYKNCDNRILDYPQISSHARELTMTLHTKKAIGPFILLHAYKTLRVDLSTLETTELKLNP
jgi:hypothetical protein